MTSDAKTPAEYIASLPEDRRKAISKIRSVIRKHLPKGFQEQMQGMLTWVVPHKIYPAGYHCNPSDPLPFAGLASQKNNLALYLMTAYSVPGMADWLKERFQAAGKKLDMGKSCIRFKKLEDVPLDVIGEAIARVSVEDYIAIYESGLPASVKKKLKK
ncbi:MAG: DUF1801 domain-containing protein [Bryobacterales bacterium]|nr:DUF1801 domain-containing protein [Bryobacterales bacterium]